MGLDKNTAVGLAVALFVVGVGMLTADIGPVGWAMTLGGLAILGIALTPYHSLPITPRRKHLRHGFRFLSLVGPSVTYGGNPNRPPALFARHLSVLNTRKDTVLVKWRVTVTVPAGMSYEAVLLTRKQWQDFGERLFPGKVQRAILSGDVINAPALKTIEGSVVAMVPALAPKDLDQVGTTILVRCEDGRGREMSFGKGIMKSRRLG